MDTEKSALEQLRELRDLSKSIKLKPSIYLKKTYVNDRGEELPIEIRNYQAIGIMNLLLVERMALCDDTGIGKTLQVLDHIGYIWQQESEYIPIIITTKSSLYQWEAEVGKFFNTNLMEPIVVYGEPFKRHEIYADFFENQNTEKKRLLLLTYDNIMFDMEPTIIREKARSPRPGFNAEFKQAKQLKKQLEEQMAVLIGAFNDIIDSYPSEVRTQVRLAAYNGEEKFGVNIVKGVSYPIDIPEPLKKPASSIFEVRKDLERATNRVAVLTNEKNPSKQVPGILNSVMMCKQKHPNAKFMLVMDEMHKLKNHRSQFHEKTRALSLKCDRLVGLTATPLKNKLMEFWSLFRVLQPQLFPKITHFQNEFCITKLIRVPGGRQVPIIIGYKNLDKFVQIIEPFYLSRKKYEVEKELPQLLLREVECELSSEQEELYDMAESGLLAVDTCRGLTSDDFNENSEILKSMTLCQQAVNAPQLILDSEGNPFEGGSSKIDNLLDLIQNEADGQKMIIFSRFEKMISLVEGVLNKNKIKCTRITGKEKDSKLRQKNRELFQDPKSGVNVILITTAGSESLNLQAAEHFVFLDHPWSEGDLVQLIGRMVRIGSSYVTVVAHHFLARRRSGEKTIDHHVLKALRSKMNLADKVSGVALQGGIQFSDEDMLKVVFNSMRSGDHKSTDVNKRANVKSMARKALPSKKKKPLLLESQEKIEDPFKDFVKLSGPDFSGL
jgi:SNF2 family DNA or RNA helicase